MRKFLLLSFTVFFAQASFADYREVLEKEKAVINEYFKQHADRNAPDENFKQPLQIKIAASVGRTEDEYHGHYLTDEFADRYFMRRGGCRPLVFGLRVIISVATVGIYPVVGGVATAGVAAAEQVSHAFNHKLHLPMTLTYQSKAEVLHDMGSALLALTENTMDWNNETFQKLRHNAFNLWLGLSKLHDINDALLPIEKMSVQLVEEVVHLLRRYSPSAEQKLPKE
jgi:hypothetical protein